MTTSNRQTSRSPDEGSDATGAAEVSTSRRQFVRGVGVGLGGLAIGKSTGVSVAAESMPTPRLHVEGQWLKDPNGNDVVLRGLNTVDPWWGDEHAGMRGSTFDDTLDLITDPDRGWHPHVVRLPFEYAQGELGVQQTIDQYIRPLVDFLAERDTYAIIDYHRIERWDTDDVDRRLRAFWDAVAPEFADDEHVLFELFNEPTEPYGEGQAHWDQWKETAQPWLDLIRDHAPETPVIVGSPKWSKYTRYAAANPLDDDNVLYTSHLYPGHVDSDELDALAAVSEDVPVFVTEWGYIDRNDMPDHLLGTTSGYGQRFRAFLETNPNLNWTAWCADSAWDPVMFDTDWNVLGGERYMGEFTKRFLSAKRYDDLPSSALWQLYSSVLIEDERG
jgi:hypothetical protein